jgi:hopanoid biosynthesis associated protein HpnK
MMRKLIVTADDFGAAPAVNDAVERAHQDGILTAASLMVAGEAAADAVARAKALPALGVGLHLVLVEGVPVLSPRDLPDLVGSDGHFRTDMAALGAEIFFRPRVRAQVRAEIEAQFAAFATTGLSLDHVNAHKHFHLHPTIAALIVEIGRRYGMRAARAPIEPVALLQAIEPVKVGLAGRVAAPWARAVGRRFARAGVVIPDRVFGLAWSGAMTRERLFALIERLPEGLTEVYTHPAIDDRHPGHAPGYRYRDEFLALTDAGVKAEAAAREIILGNFASFTTVTPP